MLAVLRDGFGDSSTAAAPALRMTGGGRLEWGIRVCSSVFGCVRLWSVEESGISPLRWSVPWWEWGGGMRTIPQSALQTAPFTQGRLDKERTE